MADDDPIESLVDEIILPNLLTDFGIVKKIQQKVQLEDEKLVPYWASCHKYDSSIPDWGETSIPLMQFTQSGKKHYFGVIELGMADAMCRVPSLAESTDTMEIARRTINNETTEQYQRPIQFNRIDNLETFLKKSPTIVNPIILHIPVKSRENGSVEIRENANGKYEMKIDLKKIPYILRTNRDVDTKSGNDFRPIDLVDGQHRVRASRTNQNSVSTNVPFILLDNEMDTSDAARVFAEINVQHEKLKDLHEMHLRYVLSLPSHIESMDFGKVPDKFVEGEDELKTGNMRQRYANRMAYRIGANLTFDEKSPLHTLIRYFDNHAGPVAAIDAKQWVKYAGKWILEQYGPEWDEAKVTRMIQSYFEAWKITANLDPRTGEIYEDVQTSNRWGKISNPRRGKDYNSRAFDVATFKALMSLFPMCVELTKAEEIHSEDELKTAFLKVLTPCQVIDFADVNIWKDRIFGSGNPDAVEAHLYHWMAWAVRGFAQTGKKESADDAWNTDETTDVDSDSGKGFFSGINTSHFRGVLRVENLNSSTEIEGMTISVGAEPIPNESKIKTITIQYLDKSGKIQPINKISGNFKGPYKKVGYNAFSQTMGTGPDTRGVSKVIITITSGNLFGENTDLFRQEYTINELKDLNGRVVYLSAQKRGENRTSGGLQFSEVSLSAPSPYEHYDVEFPDNDEEEDEEEDEYEFDFSDNILPQNSFSSTNDFIVSRKTNPCNQCFFGTDHRCGWQRDY